MNESSDKLWFPILIGWTIALMATLGSLFLSDIMKFPPCSLCWYQRVGVYPLVAILAVGFLKRDKQVFLYAFPLVSFGLLVALYHLLLYYHVIPESIAPCTKDVPCTSRYDLGVGFLSIPLLSLVNFCLLAACLLWFRCKLSKSGG